MPNESLRIAIDARSVADHFPGIGRYVYNLISALATLDHPHRLLVITSEALANTRHDLLALAAHANVELIAVDAAPFSLAEQVRIPVLLRQLRADLYHAPYYVRPYGRMPCPSITTLYDVIPRLFPAEVSPRARALFDVCMRLAIARSVRLLAISQSARGDIAGAYGVAPERMAVTPLAADARFQPQPQAQIEVVRARYRLPEHYVLCVASNKPHKNLLLLVHAWADIAAQFPNTALVIAGHWDARFPEARDQAHASGIAEQVRFLHNVAEVDLPALYSGATIFAYPSRYEGFGLPPLEALACGAPVVCAAVSSLPEVVGAAALQVDVDDHIALAAAIARLLKQPTLREQLRQAGRAQAATFAWSRTAQQTLAAYATAASK